MARTPAIQKPREFTTPGGARAAAEAIDAIRIRLERLESSQDAGTDLDALRQELLALIRQIEVPAASTSGRARSILLPAESMSTGDLVAVSTGGAVRADTATLAHAGTVIGLVYEPLSEGRISIAADGDIVSSDAWSWDIGDVVYAGADGALSDDPGSEIWMRRVGVAVESTSVLVVMGEPSLISTDPDTLFLAIDGGMLAARQAISVRTGEIAGIVAARADGVLDPSLQVIGQASDSTAGIYTGKEGEAFIYAWEQGITDEHGIDGDGRLIEA